MVDEQLQQQDCGPKRRGHQLQNQFLKLFSKKELPLISLRAFKLENKPLHRFIPNRKQLSQADLNIE